MTPIAPPNQETRRLDGLIAGGRIAEAEALAWALLRDDDVHVHAVIGLAQCALIRGDRNEALRWAERASRFAPDDVAIKAFLGALLIAADRPAAALPLLEGAAERSVNPTAAIALGQALARVGALDRLVALVDRLLRRFPVAVAPLLADLADHAVLAGGTPGWAAADPGLALVGALRPTQGAVVRITPRRTGAAPLLSLDVDLFARRYGRAGGREDLVRFTVPLGSDLEGRPLDITVDGAADFLGLPVLPIRHPAVEGSALLTGSRLSGWAWRPGDPPEAVTVRVADAIGGSVVVATDRPIEDVQAFGAEDGDYGFVLDPEAAGLAPGFLQVTAGPGDVPLVGSPLLWPGPGRTVRPQVPVGPRPTRAAAAAGAPRGVDVLIPVHRGREETMACIRSVLASSMKAGLADGAVCEVVVIDDASPEPDLVDDLAALAAAGRIVLLRNDRNLGFPATVNRGLRLHPDRDVVLLNADTLVAGDWLARLRAAAWSAHDVGTVTPLSNEATILSYPSGKERPPPPTALETAELDRLARTANAGLRVEIPTAVGFCVYIRRDCLNETGLFEETLFGRGYGEENDFCLRARRLGWRHLAAADVFVAHVGGRSFGRQKTLLGARNARLLESLHPGYDALIRDFIAADPLLEARRNLDLARWMGDPSEPDRPALALVTLAGRGGVSRFMDERVASLAAEGWRVLRLSPEVDDEPDDDRKDAGGKDAGDAAASGAERSARKKKKDIGLKQGAPAEPRCRVVVEDRPDLRDLVFRTRAEFDALVAMLRWAGVDAVEIHHVLGHDPVVLDLPARLGRPYDLTVHDYALICPRVNLVNADGRYCGEPELAVCERCTADPDDRFDATLTATALRRRTRGLVAGARRVTAPTRDVAARLLRYVDPRPIGIRSWDAVPPPPQARPGRPSGGRWRVCVIGAVGVQKGYDVLLACARDAARRDLPLEFVLVGFSEDDPPLFETGRVFVTGRFAEEEAVALVRAQESHLAFLPSISPETWCYALSTAWRAGLEVVAFDIGAVAERIRAHGGGRLLPLSLDAAAINGALLGILDASTPSGVAISRSDYPRSSFGLSVQAMPPEGSSRFTQAILPHGDTSMIGSAPTAAAQQQSQIKATAQSIALAPGFYSFMVTGGGGDGLSGDLPLPSVHLAPAPGAQVGAGIDMMGTRQGNWLTKPGDVVVIKVAGAGGNIVLTSYKHIDHPNALLSLQFARLDDASASQPAALQAVAPATPVVAPVTPPVLAPMAVAQPAFVAPTVPPLQPRVEILAHIQRHGDLRFNDGDWAGCVGQRVWIEAFAITPMGGLEAEDLEYKGLTANGWETPWMTAGNMCGSRGLGTPLIGFSIRLRGAAAERFDCVYEGAFVSGHCSTAGRNGSPCRSDMIGDALEGIRLSFVAKQAAPGQPRPF